MIEQRAVILRLEPNSAEQSIAILEIVRKTACGLCGQTRGCGNSIWGKLFGHKSTSFKAQNSINANVGDNVIVGINESALMKSALLLYMLPLATMFIGAILASILLSNDLLVVLGAIIGLALGFLWVKGHMAGRAYYVNNQPKILRLANHEDEEKVVHFQ